LAVGVVAFVFFALLMLFVALIWLSLVACGVAEGSVSGFVLMNVIGDFVPVQAGSTVGVAHSARHGRSHWGLHSTDSDEPSRGGLCAPFCHLW